MNNPVAQLAWPLAASLALHLAAGWLLSAGSGELSARQDQRTSLTVTLAGAPQPEPRQAAPAEPAAVPQEAPAPAGTPSSDGRITQKPRFILAPDLSALETIAVPFSGSLTLRLHVSSLGTVDRVDVLKGDPVPGELLDGLRDKLGQARLSPALAGSQPVSGTVDLVIRYESAPVPLKRGP